MDIALGIFLYLFLTIGYIGITLIVGFWWFLLFFKIYRAKYKAEFKKWLEE